ncbi:hypothetical protein [Yoonia sp.]|uniref:hypothetical protein n=1 Tax=Yoonia sp. TaxID=2212373 RepID=UPI0019E1B666|nr:hypothetical protein [Yoonia sp.]MBE0412003.1 hypothetical protein [Yoonia sp.]
MIRGLLVGLTLSNPAHAADFWFCWIGANDYTMTGEMAIPDAALSKPVITATDVTHFKITGYHAGQFLGTWDIATRTPDDTWVLNFDPATRSFMPGDAPGYGYTQGWNADGTAADCGAGEFGFNSGNYAQDFCIDGVWIEESGVPPNTLFLVSTVPVDPLCRIMAPLG